MALLKKLGNVFMFFIGCIHNARELKSDLTQKRVA